MPADLVFHNGPVFTSDGSHASSRAVGITKDWISAVVADSEIGNLIGRETRVVDLEGRLLTPGFQDSHVHPSSSGLDLLRCNFEGCGSAQDALDYLARYVETHPNDEWVVGSGWHQTWFPRGCPPKDLLDTVVNDRPVLVWNADGHGAWVNSRALDLAGVDAATTDPRDGRIERNPDGSPQGTLHEGAAALVERVSPPDTMDDFVAGILAGQEYLVSKGITAWLDAHVDAPVHGAYRSLAEQGRLEGRALGSIWWDRHQGMEQLEDVVRMSMEGVGRYRPVSVKLMTDGVVETNTAAMLEPYFDLGGKSTGNRGIDFIDPGHLAEIVVALDRRGLSCHFHAIGDAAVRNSLDAVQAARSANGWSAARHVICHIQVVHPDDYLRFRSLGVSASAQPLWASDGRDQRELTMPFLGEERSSWQYPFGSLLRAGATLAMGSDWGVSTADVMDQIDVAVNRLNPDEPDLAPLNGAERIGLADALAAFTTGSAYVNHREGDSGAIAPGMLADLVVLDRDPFAGGPIRDTGVDMTIVGGQVVYEEG